MRFNLNRGVEEDQMPYFFNEETRSLVENAMFSGPYGAIGRTMKVYGKLEPRDRYESGNGDIRRFLPVIWLYIKAYEYFNSESTYRWCKRWLYRWRLRSFLNDYLKNIQYFANMNLNEVYIVARAATTIQDWSLAHQIIEYGLEKTRNSPGHAIRGRLIALSLLNPNCIIRQTITSPESDCGCINFGNYDLETKALFYRSYAEVLGSKLPARACAFLKVAYGLIANMPIDRTIYSDYFSNLSSGELTIAEWEKFNLWNKRYMISGIIQPYPS